MRNRIAMWALAGFLVAAFWGIYAFATTAPAMTSGDPLMTLVRLTCPITLLNHYPLSVYLVLAANAATYALVGLILETLRRQPRHAN